VEGAHMTAHRARRVPGWTGASPGNLGRGAAYLKTLGFSAECFVAPEAAKQFAQR